jgi:hypothetical protein
MLDLCWFYREIASRWWWRRTCHQDERSSACASMVKVIGAWEFILAENAPNGRTIA